MTDEVRITSETGGQKGAKPAKVSALDPIPLLEIAEVAGFGAEKYERFNYLRGYDWGLSYDALRRHLMAFWSGEDEDPESGKSHLAHAAWHCMALLSFQRRGLGTDDRPPRIELADPADTYIEALNEALIGRSFPRYQGPPRSTAHRVEYRGSTPKEPCDDEACCPVDPPIQVDPIAPLSTPPLPLDEEPVPAHFIDGDGDVWVEIGPGDFRLTMMRGMGVRSKVHGAFDSLVRTYGIADR